ncbi:MAG: hydantoinase/oxoprolinase family protein [Nitrososphaerales archaeon]
MTWNVAVDIGGTFTDLFAYNDETGEIRQGKTSTTYGNFVDGIRECIRKSGLDISQISVFAHGSTIAINTVIERKGTRTALIMTEGTRDVYVIGRGNRPDAYNILFERPVPLVDSNDTYEVKERLLASGEELKPLDKKQVLAIAKSISDSGAESVAICLLHSYQNPSHENQVAEILREKLPDAYFSLSHDILREYREYERASTTIVNSYVGPRVSKYILDLDDSLRSLGFVGTLMIMQSNGGVMSPAVASKRPVTMMESGPVGGIIAAAHISSRLGFKNAIAFDMGGTTAKTSLIKDGEPAMANGYYVGGYASGHPVMIPVVDVVEVGAGGGSIAHIDSIGRLKVGPKSAGSEPGPMCYGHGGTDPTITDANVILNRIDPNMFLGGEMPLRKDLALKGIEEKISSHLGIDAPTAALGIVSIANTIMSLAVREVSIAKGYDPRDFSLVAFGGAGPVHAVEIARDLHIPTVIIPNLPAHFSAVGMVLADVRHDYVRTYYKPLSECDFKEIATVFDEMRKAARETLSIEKVSPDSIVFSEQLDTRYIGQEFTLSVPVDDATLARTSTQEIKDRFDSIHKRRFGQSANDPAEIINLRLIAIGRRRKPEMSLLKENSKSSDKSSGKREVFLGGNKPTMCSVYRREMLDSGVLINGPAVIEEYASTTILSSEDSARVADTRELVVSVSQ